MPKSRRRYEEVGIRRRRIACQGPRPRVTVKQRRDAYAVTKLTAYATLRCGQYSAESTIAASETAARPACRRKRVMRVSREPLNKSRMAATEAFRDEVREAMRRPWQAPRASGATKQIARKAPSLRVSAQWHSSALLRGLRIGIRYSLRPQLANEA